MASILDDIQRAIDAGLYYPALVVALTLPEICASLTMDADKFVKEAHYVAFIDKYAAQGELGLEGLSCYRLRGGVVHRGNVAGHPFFGSTHVVFTIPETRAGMHGFSIYVGGKTAAMFDLKMFCSAMDRAVRRWYADHKGDQQVQANIRNLLSWRPNGMRPFLAGAPVVASGPE